MGGGKSVVDRYACLSASAFTNRIVLSSPLREAGVSRSSIVAVLRGGNCARSLFANAVAGEATRLRHFGCISPPAPARIPRCLTPWAAEMASRMTFAPLPDSSAIVGPMFDAGGVGNLLSIRHWHIEIDAHKHPRFAGYGADVIQRLEASCCVKITLSRNAPSPEAGIAMQGL